MSKTLKEMFDEALEKGQGMIITVGGNAKSACSEIFELAETKKQLEARIYNLGVGFYEEYVDKKTTKPYKKFEDDFVAIIELSKRENELQAAIDKRLGKRVCPNCGEKIDFNVPFCPNCGAAQEVEEEKELICPKCGAEHAEDQCFCGSCGVKLK